MARLGILYLLVLSLAGCQQEYFYGPYQLQLPTDLKERSSYRTFRMPLGPAQQQQRQSLLTCEQNQPDREIPCRCEFPVLEVTDWDLKLDYRLENLSASITDVNVWIGVTDSSDEIGVLPDLPNVAIFSQHLHRLKSKETVLDLFSEDELQQATIDFADEYFEICTTQSNNRPAPLQLLIGMSIYSEPEDEQLFFESTIRLR